MFIRPCRSPFWFALILLFAIAIPAAAKDIWIEVRSPHFIVAGNCGENDARRIANQFEQIRAVFLNSFPLLRVDPGKPVIVLALKNEDSMKVLLPDYWISKDGVRPTGLFVPGLDRDFAVLRTDASGSGENPYHSLWYEYTQVVFGLNFGPMPLWLRVGLAEYFGNTIVDKYEIAVGHVNRMELQLLKRYPLIPIQALLHADSRSPLVNDGGHASIFHAESWLLVHYLLEDPDAKRASMFYRLEKGLDESSDPEKVAQEVLGDLNHVQRVLETYARQSEFHYDRLKPQSSVSENSYPLRELPAAEALTLQADFLAHAGHAKDAQEMTKQALALQPALAGAYVTSGYINYLLHENASAESDLNKAISLDSLDFRPYHFRALLILRTTGYRKDSTPQIIGNLERVTFLNPDFAPAWGFLSVAYREQDETKAKSFDAAVKAAKLEPSNLAFTADIGYALLALNHEPEAEKILERLNSSAKTPNEKSTAESFARHLASHNEEKQKTVAVTQENGAASSTTVQDADEVAQTASGVAAGRASSSEFPNDQISRQEGVIRDAECNAANVNLHFAILGETLALSASDITKISIRLSGKESALSAMPCEQWKGRKAQLTYTPAPDNQITSIDFFQ